MTDASLLFSGKLDKGGGAAAWFTLSAIARDPARLQTREFEAWWAARRGAGKFEVSEIAFADLVGWDFKPRSGNLVHETGRFFTVEGIRTKIGNEFAWSQPTISQPEIGILGILVKEFNGVIHCLMQAKMEPGNINTLQLSPTVQATRSNYMRVHQGNQTRYLEYFRNARKEQVLVDVLQSEQGSWFWHKQNRNMVVMAVDDVPLHEDYCWLTLEQVRKLLLVENLVNMDVRTVLACMPFDSPMEYRTAEDGFTYSLLNSYVNENDRSHNTLGHVLSWLTDAKERCEWRTKIIPLAEVSDWTRTGYEIADTNGEHFRIIAVSVRAGNREVKTWTQPLLAPRSNGLAAFLVRPIRGVLHLLVQARPEPGLLDRIEMAPTVQVEAANDVSKHPVRFLEFALTDDPRRVRYDVMLSEEGGRFYRAQTRYRIIELSEEFPVDVPEDFCWITVGQLMQLLRHGHYVNVEARSLLACLHSLW